MALFCFNYSGAAQSGNDVFTLSHTERVIKKVWLTSRLYSGAAGNYIYDIPAQVLLYANSATQGRLLDIPAAAAITPNIYLTFSTYWVWQGNFELRFPEVQMDFFYCYPTLIAPDPGDVFDLTINMLIES